MRATIYTSLFSSSAISVGENCCQNCNQHIAFTPLYWNCGASSDQRHSRSTGSRRFRPFCSLRHGRPHYTHPLPGDVLWHLLHCSKIVSDISGTANVVCAVRRLQFRAVNAAVWGSTRICPWTHAVSASLYTVDLIRLIEGHGLYPHLYAEKKRRYTGSVVLWRLSPLWSAWARASALSPVGCCPTVYSWTQQKQKHFGALPLASSPLSRMSRCCVSAPMTSNQESTSATSRYTPTVTYRWNPCVADRVQLFCIPASHTQHPPLRL